MFDVDPSAVYFFEPDHGVTSPEHKAVPEQYLSLLNCDAGSSFLTNGWQSLRDLMWNDGNACNNVEYHCAISWKPSDSDEDLQQTCKGKAVVALKTIEIGGQMAQLLPAWSLEPNFALIHIVRDARGFLASFLRKEVPSNEFTEWAKTSDAQGAFHSQLRSCMGMQRDLSSIESFYAQNSKPALVQLNAEAFIGGSSSVEICVVDRVRRLLGLPSLESLRSKRLGTGTCTNAARESLERHERLGDGSWSTVAGAFPGFEAAVEESCPQLFFFDKPWTLRTYGFLDTPNWPRPPPPSSPPLSPSPIHSPSRGSRNSSSSSG